MKATIKRILSLIMVFAIAVITYVPAFAIDSSSSDKTTKTVGGYTYTYYSYIQRWSPKLSARVHAIANKTVPIGYIGTRARMYRADGGLEGAADWTYNDDPLVGQDTYIC